MIRLRFDRVVREAACASLVTALVAAALGAVWLRATRVAGDPSVWRFVAWTLIGGVTTAVIAWLMSPTFRRVEHGDNPRLHSLGLPNLLTLVRFALIAPTVVLLADRRYPEALAGCIVLFATDVADGIVARRRGRVSEFGVVADPLADVASTFAVFTVFVRQGHCPTWLYALLAARYAMLLLGSLGLVWATGPIRFQATVPGKVVGVVQSLGACLIIGGAMAGGLDPAVEGALFAFLGIGFASIVLSQAIIGWRLARRRSSRGGPTR